MMLNILQLFCIRQSVRPQKSFVILSNGRIYIGTCVLRHAENILMLAGENTHP